MDRPPAELIPLLNAFAYATRSTCSQRKTGCVITDDRMLRVIGVGYNGNYQGGPHKCDFPEAKGQARCGCVHAEQNAIAKSSFAIGLVAFTTTVPCSLCAKQLFNAGIRKVVTVISSDDEYSKPTEFRVNSVALMKEMGMSLIFHNINELQDLIGHIVDIMKIIGPDTACGSTQK